MIPPARKNVERYRVPGGLPRGLFADRRGRDIHLVENLSETRPLGVGSIAAPGTGGLHPAQGLELQPADPLSGACRARTWASVVDKQTFKIDRNARTPEVCP
jgi:hypothetical protein